MTILIAFIAWQVVYFASEYWGFDVIAPSNVFEIAEPISIALVSAWGLLWLPFKRHEEQQEKHDGEMLALNSKLSALQNRKENRDFLGICLSRLQQKIVAIQGMSGFEPKHDEILKEERDASLELIEQIRLFLEKDLGHAEAATFVSKAGLISSPQKEAFDTGSIRWNKRANIVDHLKHWASHLTQIIENYK